jgi:hypothetical protein
MVADKFNELGSNYKYPRMSPQAKHRMYNDYVKGMNVRDICLKYGVMSERAYAIIWQKEYFYKIVYPKIGETTARL